MVSIVLALAVESPVNRLEKLLLPRSPRLIVNDETNDKSDMKIERKKE